MGKSTYPRQTITDLTMSLQMLNCDNIPPKLQKIINIPSNDETTHSKIKTIYIY